MINTELRSKKYPFSNKTVDCFYRTDFSLIREMLDVERTIFITDKHVFSLHKKKFEGWKTIVIPAGEKNKNQQAADQVIDQMIQLGADRQSFVVGVGGGVVTDLAGYVASVYMRGIKFAFAPTTILAMVDASIGGKNGVDVGIYKNLVGTINQPEFLLYDFQFLNTLPVEEWRSGFAEIIKHACINDHHMFQFLEERKLEDFINDLDATGNLVERNVDIKHSIVSGDEKETGARKLLNFGHTIGHAIENIHGLLHGYAISIGMVAACTVSEKINDFSPEETNRIIALFNQYALPVSIAFEKEKTWDILLRDKKKSGSDMDFVVLNKIGSGGIKKIPLDQLKIIFDEL
ncbi:MAG: 3-dehydroquinate synthase [Ginsengibacter sp.]